MKKQPRVAIYHRANHSNNTALLHHLEAYAQKGNLKPTIFLDIESGAGQRPALDDLLNHVRSQKVDIIIIHSLSRFSRNSSEVTDILDEFRKNNVKLAVPNVQTVVAYHE